MSRSPTLPHLRFTQELARLERIRPDHLPFDVELDHEHVAASASPVSAWRSPARGEGPMW